MYFLSLLITISDPATIIVPVHVFSQFPYIGYNPSSFSLVSFISSLRTHLKKY